MTTATALVVVTLHSSFSGERITSAAFCEDLVSPLSITTLKKGNSLSVDELSSEASKKILEVSEFEFIRAEAKKLGLHAWLFGGSAASYLHYVKWNLAREKGLMDLHADRFDFDFSSIFRSSQDIDVVIDGSTEQASVVGE